MSCRVFISRPEADPLEADLAVDDFAHTPTRSKLSFPAIHAPPLLSTCSPFAPQPVLPVCTCPEPVRQACFRLDRFRLFRLDRFPIPTNRSMSWAAGHWASFPCATTHDRVHHWSKQPGFSLCKLACPVHAAESMTDGSLGLRVSLGLALSSCMCSLLGAVPTLCPSSLR